MHDDGPFVPLGNIFDEGLAEKYEIKQRTEGQDEVRFVKSESSYRVGLASHIGMYV